MIEFCKNLIETFLIVILRLYTNKCTKDEITNGLNVIYVRHEQNQFAIKIENGSNISAGFAHSAAIIDGSCYLWGSNGVNCALSAITPNTTVDSSSETSPRCLEFISNMGLEVHAVKCGKAHTLILTNNGVSCNTDSNHRNLKSNYFLAIALQIAICNGFKSAASTWDRKASRSSIAADACEGI